MCREINFGNVINFKHIGPASGIFLPVTYVLAPNYICEENALY
jgi:hypothetical protein